MGTAHNFTLRLILLSAVCMLVARGQQDPNPDQNRLDLTFTVEGEEVTLNLQENPHITPDFPVILGKQGRFINWTGQTNDFAAYLDPGSGASLLVHNRTTSDGRLQPSYMGLFRVDDTDYMIEPVTNPETKRKKRSLTFDLGDLTSLDHVMYQPVADDLAFESDSHGMPNVTMYEREWASFSQDMNLGLLGDPVKADYAVELFLVLDFAVYESWYSRSTAFDAKQREDEAINNIRYYFAHIVNGIDLRYQSIQQFDYGIHVKLSGILIAQTPEDSYWTEKPENSDPGFPRRFTHAYKALDDFEDWMNEFEDILPPFDAAMLFSANNLFGSYRDDGSHRGISGLADIKGACTNLRASVNQENGQYASIQTGAHELGHNVGALHDGNSQVGCTGRDQFIMASSPGVLTDLNYQNALTFSPCSIQSFRVHLNFLTMEKKNCLLNQVDHFNKDEIMVHLSTLPGQVYSPDDQCKVIYGDTSYYCAGGSGDAEICRKMLCYDPSRGKCYGHTEQRSAEGTTCGNNKWCILGDCVYSEKAPAAPDMCIYGDFVGEMNDGRTCQELVSNSPWDCYRDHWFADCCQSCGNIKNNTWTDCEFGDHDSSCADADTRDCYFENTMARCCSSCEARKSQNPKCLFGDHASWCTTISPGSCYGSNDTCCHSCPLLHSGDESCPYGDSASWCPSQDYRNCYDNNQRCCQSCKQYYTGIAGCEYGDRDRHCTQTDCQQPHRLQACCNTCRNKETDPSSTTTTTTTTSTTTTTTDPGCRDNAHWCATMRISDCYTSNTTCCATCQRYYNPNKKFCEYGDRASWCPDYVGGQSDNCMVNDVATVCCKSCEQHENETPAVDTASWCSTMARSDCYLDSIEKTCGFTCAVYRTGPPGCEYGDMYTWCPNLPRVLCPTTARECCVSC